jgi:hypothetical protein
VEAFEPFATLRAGSWNVGTLESLNVWRGAKG